MLSAENLIPFLVLSHHRILFSRLITPGGQQSINKRLISVETMMNDILVSLYGEFLKKIRILMGAD